MRNRRDVCNDHGETFNLNYCQWDIRLLTVAGPIVLPLNHTSINLVFTTDRFIAQDQISHCPTAMPGNTVVMPPDKTLKLRVWEGGGGCWRGQIPFPGD